MSEKKKIGILTFHYAHNYGAVLQAYALKTKLTQMGYDVKVLNYRNKYIARLYRKVLHIDFWKRDILPSRWKMDIERIYDVLYGLGEWKIQWEKFENFIDKMLLDKTQPETKGHSRILGLSDLHNCDCDIFVLGSDQIWCRELTHGLDAAYFGQFAPDKKKISYAASVPNADIPENEKPYFKEYLKALDAISVREEKLAEELKQLVEKEVTTVVDPTLLMEKEDYADILLKKQLTDQEYIVAYYVVESDLLEQCAKREANRLGMKLIEIHSKKTSGLKKREKEEHTTMVYDAGPAEFLTYIRDAQMVLTNSFHGTVFSILFEKEFFSVVKKNGRIENLLFYAGLENRQVTECEQLTQKEQLPEINYQMVKPKIEAYRQQSIDYLKKALGEEHI